MQKRKAYRGANPTKLSVKLIEAVKQDITKGALSIRTICFKHGVTRCTVINIAEMNGLAVVKKTGHNQISDTTTEAVKRDLLNGMTSREIAETHGVSVNTIRKIRKTIPNCPQSQRKKRKTAGSYRFPKKPKFDEAAYQADMVKVLTQSRIWTWAATGHSAEQIVASLQKEYRQTVSLEEVRKLMKTIPKTWKGSLRADYAPAEEKTPTDYFPDELD